MLIPTITDLRKKTKFRPAHICRRCDKIVEICADFLIFRDDSGYLQHINACFVPFWGRDIYAEILADYFNSSGLNVNNPRRKEYFEEAKSYIDRNDIIRFCNDNKNRWVRSIYNLQSATDN
jgi:hypothetical protein